jgi:hypothetical protein
VNAWTSGDPGITIDSNEIDESDLQREKQKDPRISTPFGITIDSSDDLENALDPIWVTPVFSLGK